MEQDNLKIKLFSILFCCSLLLSGCVSAVMTSANAIYNHNDLQHKANNYYIAFHIKNAIENDPQLASQTNIGVTSFNRIVLLTGQAQTEQLRQRVISIAQNAPNVIRVYNAITIGNPTSASTSAEDTWITTKVKAKFIASNELEPGKIKVVTENHVVYLMGIVPKDQADIAVELTRHTAGVEKVIKIFYYVIMPKIE